MTVKSFVTYEGKRMHNVNGCNLTAEQILDLDSKGELMSRGIAALARKYKKEE